MSRPVDEILFTAIHTHSARTRGQAADRVTLHYRDGSETTLPVPDPASDAAVAEAIISWPPPDGWAFRPGEAALNGVRFRLAGKLIVMLRVLAERPGEPVSVEKLKRAVWDERPEDVEDNNLHGHVSQLRKRLRDALGLTDLNPIAHADGAYRLVVY